MNPRHFCINGREYAAEPYHYRECGLDYVYLVNGFSKEAIDGEEYVTVDDVDGLWKAIGLQIVLKQKTLDPAEIRFLRGQMDMTQVELAGLLRISDQTVARWEKGQTELPGPADMALRMLFLGSPVAHPEGKSVLANLLGMMRELVDKDDAGSRATYFMQGSDRWSEAIAA